MGLALLALPAAAAPGVELAYGYEPGTAYRTEIDSDSEMRLRSEDPEAEARLEPYREIRQKVTMTWEQTFSPAEEASLLSFQATLTELGVSMLVGGVPAPISSEIFGALEGMSLNGTMDGKGRMAGLRVEGGGGAGAEQMGEELTALSPELPEEPLSPGESFRWDRPVIFPAPMGLGEPVEGTVAATLTLREVSGKQALFVVATEVSIASGDAGADLALSGRGEGEATFDLERGFFVSSSMTLRLSRSLTRPLPVTLEGTTRVHSTTTALAE